MNKNCAKISLQYHEKFTDKLQSNLLQVSRKHQFFFTHIFIAKKGKKNFKTFSFANVLSFTTDSTRLFRLELKISFVESSTSAPSNYFSLSFYVEKFRKSLKREKFHGSNRKLSKMFVSTS